MKKTFDVVFKFQTENNARCFLAYMSDGGGEYRFLENAKDFAEEEAGATHYVSGFDYCSDESDDLVVVAEETLLELDDAADD